MLAPKKSFQVLAPKKVSKEELLGVRTEAELRGVRTNGGCPCFAHVPTSVRAQEELPGIRATKLFLAVRTKEDF